MRAYVIVLAILSCGCSARHAPEATITVVVTNDSGRPVPGAVIAIDRDHTGTTGPDGRLVSRARGLPGRRLTVEARCPAGWRANGDFRRTVPLRPLEEFGEPASAGGTVEIRFVCVPARRPQVVIVRTDGRAGLPIVVLGREIGVTDADGVFQTLIDEAPGEEVEIAIDTTDAPSLRPANPRRRFVVPEESRILLFDQRFEEKRHLLGRGRLPARRGPRRL